MKYLILELKVLILIIQENYCTIKPYNLLKKRVHRLSFGEKLKDLRCKAGMTQLQLANKVNVTKSVISYYEHKKDKKPSVDILIEFSEIFNVSLEELLEIEEVNKEQVDVSGLTEDDIVAVNALINTLRKKNKE